ncbi:MAG: hypothetical protein U0514_01070 [Candidatus Andersenbacteria bacterium]
MPIGVLIALLAATVTAAAADTFLKQSTAGATFAQAVRNPLMLVVVALYLAQIGLLAVTFVRHAKLGVIGPLQTVLYSLLVVATGFFIFHERLSVSQLVGVGFALVAVVLLAL